MKWLDLGLPLLVWLALAVAGAAVVGPLWWLGGRRRLLPLRRAWRARWNGLDVLAVLILSQVVPAAVYFTLVSVHVFQPINTDGGEPTPAVELLLSQVAALPILLVLIVSFLWLGRGARPAHVGLTCTRGVPNTVAGYLVWVAVTPPILGLYFVLLHFFPEQQHQLLNTDVRAHWLLLLVGVSVAAPLAEELIFRGVLLQWSLKVSFERQLLIPAGAVLMATVYGFKKDASFNPAPLAFVGLMLPGFLLLPYLLLPRRPEPGSGLEALALPDPWWVRLVEPAQRPEARPVVAVYANGLLFGAVHSTWPAPIPLVVLGTALAWLSYRTRSLVGPVLVHALFNGVTFLTLLLERLYLDPK
jgi:membrane protease YdiL (CAAX protease family)